MVVFVFAVRNAELDQELDLVYIVFGVFDLFYIRDLPQLHQEGKEDEDQLSVFTFFVEFYVFC